MGIWDSIKGIFTKATPAVGMGRTVATDEIGIFKAYIPEFIYKPPFGFPRKENLPLLRNLARTPYVFSVVKTLCDEASSLDWDIVIKEDVENPEQWEEARLEALNFFRNPNANEESWEHIQRGVIRDILELDSGVIVKVFNKTMKFVQMYARDGLTFLKNPDIYGHMGNREDFVMPFEQEMGVTQEEAGEPVVRNFYDQYLTQTAAYFQYGWTAGSYPVPFGRREIVYIMQNPKTESVYGRSPVEILADTIMTLFYGGRYHLDYYINSNIPEGLLSIPDAQDDEIKALVERFKDSFTRLDALDNQRRIGHKIPYTSAKDPKFIPFQLPPREMQIIEQSKWYTKVLWACFGVTPDEMGFTETSNRAVSFEMTKVFKRKAIRPICNVMTYHVNTQILPEFVIDKFKDWNDAIKNCPLEFKYQDYDQDEDYKRHEILKMEIDMGVRTPEMAAGELGINVEDLKTSKEERFNTQQQRMDMFKKPGDDDEEEEPDEQEGPLKKEENNKKKREEGKYIEEKAKTTPDERELTSEIKEHIKEVGKMLEEATKYE